MKTLTPVFLLLYIIFYSSQSYGQKSTLRSLLFSKQFPQLEVALSASGINRNDKIIYQAFLLNAYNKPAASDKLLAEIFSGKINRYDDSLQFFLHKIAYDNKVKLNNYRSAFLASELLLTKFSKFFSASELEDQKEESKIWNFYKNTPAQKILAQKKTVVPVRHDLAGLWNIPVSYGDSTYQFIFDTGAGISTITQTFATKLKVNILQNSAVSIRGGLNGISTIVKLGVAKQIQIGNLLIQNAIFLIFPDSALSFAGGAYKINGIIGLPIIKDFGEVTISKNKMTVPLKKDLAANGHNMILDLLKPVIYIKYNGASLPCTFDCGAQSTLFSDNFYHRFRQVLDKEARHDSAQIAGAGGQRIMQLVEVPDLHFFINSAPVHLLKAQVSLEPLNATDQFYYGNIGQDIINQFESVTMNFLTSGISFKKK